MSKFKIGDRVRTTGRDPQYWEERWQNKIATIKHIYSGGDPGYEVLFEDGMECYSAARGLVPLNQPEDLYPGEHKYNTKQYLEFVKTTLDDLQILIQRKNSDYTNGAGPFANFEQASDFGVDPFKGLMVRMGDKMQRIKSFCSKGELQVANEGVDDALKDLIGYSLIGLAMLDERKRGAK